MCVPWNLRIHLGASGNDGRDEEETEWAKPYTLYPSPPYTPNSPVLFYFEILCENISGEKTTGSPAVKNLETSVGVLWQPQNVYVNISPKKNWGKEVGVLTETDLRAGPFFLPAMDSLLNVLRFKKKNVWSLKSNFTGISWLNNDAVCIREC